MQICQDHWHELKNAIRRRGMWKLISPDSSCQRPGHSATGSTFDPLHAATRMISDQAVMAFGSDLEFRRCCPLCEVEQNLGRGRSFEWINVDADAILEVCKERHLVTSE